MKIYKIFTMLMMGMAIFNANAKDKNPYSGRKDTKKDYVVSAFYTCKDYNAARDVAYNRCFALLSHKIETKVSSAVKTYSMTMSTETKKGVKMDGNHITETIIKSISKATIKGVKTEDKIKGNDRKGYTAYVCMTLPKTFKAKEVVESILNDKDIDPATKEMIKADRAEFEVSLEKDFANY